MREIVNGRFHFSLSKNNLPMNHQPVEGFSKLTKQGKIDWLVNEYLEGNSDYQNILNQYWNENAGLQKLHDEFSENTISNFYMPY